MRCFNPDLFLCGLPIGIAPGKLRECFESVHIPTDYTEVLREKHGAPLREAMAFVRLADSADTERAVEALNGLEMGGHTIKVRAYIKKPRVSFSRPAPPTWQAHVEGRSSENEAAQ
jgi:hypothetical protein